MRKMTTKGDERFRPKPGASRDREARQTRSFLDQVADAMYRAGGLAGRAGAGTRGRGGKRGRGQVVAKLMDPNWGPRSRRVAIKVRHYRMAGAGSRALSAHLRYIVRDGASRDGSPAEAFGSDSDEADVRTFE